MPSAKIALNPDLSKRLSLPESVLNVDFHCLEQSILEELGLEPENARFLLEQEYGKPSDERCSSLAVYEGRPTAPPAKGNAGKSAHDKVSKDGPQGQKQSSPSHISFTICCDLTAPRAQANRDFDQLLNRKRSENLVPAPARFRCRTDYFRRDLVVLALSEDRSWDVVDIDLQLDFMDLPLLTEVWMKPSGDKRRVGHTDAKAARRKIVYRTRKLIEKYGQIAVFVPFSIRAVAILSEPPRKPTPFLIEMIHAVCGRRIVA